MALNQNEQALLEAVETMLSEPPHLGLDVGDKGLKDGTGGDNDPKARGFEYLHNQIDEMFAHKVADLVHHTGVCAAFAKVHGYKYLDDMTFSEVLDREMRSQGIPAPERAKAVGEIPKIIKELQEEAGAWAERDFGFSPFLDEIMEVKPEQFKTGESKKKD